MPKLADPYIQVLLTYLRRPAFQVILLLGIASFALARVIEHVGHFYYNSLLWFLLDMLSALVPFALVIVLLAMLMAHAREQLFTWRAAVIPRHRTPHILTAVAVFEILALALAWVLYWKGASFVGILAIVVTLMTLTVWVSLRWSPWLMLLALPILGAIWINRQAQYVLGYAMEFLVHPTPPQRAEDAPLQVLARVMLLALDAILLVRLVRSKVAPPIGGRGESPQFQLWQWLVRVTSPASTFDITPHGAVRGLWHRAWHRRLAVLRPRAPWWVAGLLAAIFLVMPLVAGRDLEKTDVQQAFVLQALVLTALTPGIITAALWRERWPVLGFESLFPGRPRQFAREAALAMGINLAEFWLASAAAAGVAMAVWRPRDLHSGEFLGSLLASALMQGLVWGVLFLITPLRTTVAYVGVLVVLMLAIAIPFEATWSPQPEMTVNRLLAIASLEMALGIALAGIGATVWRRAEFA